MKRLTPLLTILLLFPALPAFAGESLADKIDAVIFRPEYRQARWGVLVVNARTGETLYAHDAERLFLPASTTKLFSCAAALVDLGADHVFRTPVVRRGEVEDGVLKGDLILVGQGDLTFGGRTDARGKVVFHDDDHTYANSPTSKAVLTDTDPLAGLKALAKQIKAAGIRKVTGDVLVDDRLFQRARGSGSGPDLLSPIVVNDNVVDVVVSPGAKEGDPGRVVIRPVTSFVQVDAQVTTVGEKEPPRVDLNWVDARRFVVRGQMPLKHRPLVRIFPVEDPAGFARALFLEVLRREGVEMTASPLQGAGELPERATVARLPRVAEFTSPPLAEALAVTLKVSHNLYASTLPLLVAARHGERTLAEGMKRQGQILAGLGVDVETISFAGGAGGAAADSVTPRAAVQLLQGLAKRPDWPTYKACLPILGIDGTLAEAVKPDSPARGHVFAKTGTLWWSDLVNDRPLLRSKALAGTMTTAAGEELFVALFVNDVPLPKKETPGREGKVLGKLCEIIHDHKPEPALDLHRVRGGVNRPW